MSRPGLSEKPESGERKEENKSGDKKENVLEENVCCIPRISLFVVSSRMRRSGNRNGQGG